ncbi:MAG: hypothetical protein WC735_02940 [Candidatus Paceibacterota bacterium]|jgi:hypothetical protein
MGILDSLRKSREEKKEHATPPPQGHTLAQVLQDKNKSHLFGKLLERDGDQELASRLAEGKLEESDIALLEEKRLIFSEKIIQAEKIEKLLTKENIIDFARNHPEFEKIINLLGPEKAIKAIQGQLREISITDESRFNGILSAMETLDSYKKGEYKTVNDEVEKICKDNNISPQEYLAVLAIEDPIEKDKKLRELASRVPSELRKTMNWLSRGMVGKGGTFNEDVLRGLQSSENSLENSIAQLDLLHQDIGAVLFYSVSGNDNMRNALAGELTNEKVQEEPKSGFKEAKKEAFDEAEFEEEWENKKRYTNYERLSDAEREHVKQTFIDDAHTYYMKKNSGKGFWHNVLITLTETLINSKKDKLN